MPANAPQPVAASAAVAPSADAPPAAPPSRLAIGVAAATTLWLRDMKRFIRSRHRVISALLTPIVFWLLLGSGLDRVFVPPAELADAGDTPVGYLAFFFPGAVVMILLFTAIFSTITVIEDRREGFLQGVLVTPAPRWSIAAGKLAAGAVLAAGQGLLFLLAWPLVGDWPGWLWILGAVAMMFMLGAMLTGVGLAIAWPMKSTAGFHAVMNLLLMPMWFLSGAVFPVATAPTPLAVIMLANPLTYGQSLFAGMIRGGRFPELPGPALALLVFTLASVAIVAGCVVVIARSSRMGPRRRPGSGGRPAR